MKEAALDDEEVCPAFVQTAEGLQLGKRVLHFPGFFVDRSSRHLASSSVLRRGPRSRSLDPRQRALSSVTSVGILASCAPSGQSYRPIPSTACRLNPFVPIVELTARILRVIE